MSSLAITNGMIDPQSYISIQGNDLLTTSIKVADAFGKQHKDVLRRLENLECSQEFNRRNFAPVEYMDAKGEKRPMYEITKDGFMFLVMGFTGKQAALIKEAYITAFNWMAEKLSNSMPKVPQSFSEALRLASELVEQNEALSLERDVAVRTKAEIGSRREATAMAKASAETRRASILQEQLGVSENWKSAKAIAWLSEIFVLNKVAYQQIGKKLTAISKELGVKIEEIEDSVFGQVKAYHISAINEFQKRLQSDSQLLIKYRANEY